MLDELAKMVGALDDEIVRYLGLYFGSDESIIQGRIVLLGTADRVMIGAMERLTEWLTTESRQSLDDVNAGNLIGANQRIAQARLDVRPAREALTCAMAQLRGLQADFITAAGTV